MTETDDLHAQAKAVTDLVQYQSGAVVSRTLIKKKTGTITLFAFDAGQELSEHSAPFDALVHVLDGEAEVSISGTPHSVSAGQMIVLPANEPHAIRAVSAFTMVLAMVRE